MASNQSIISDQVSKWKAEIRRLQDLIEHASSDDKAGSNTIYDALIKHGYLSDREHMTEETLIEYVLTAFDRGSKDEKAVSEQGPAAPVDRAFIASNLPVLADNAETAIRAFGEDWAARLARDAFQLLNQYDEVLRGLAMSLSAGGYNSEGLIDPKTADEKIRWGINHIVEVESSRASTHTDSKAPIDERARFEAWRTEFLQSTGRISVTPYEAWQARARLASQVPDGWKLVPIDPTHGMMDAFNSGRVHLTWGDCYRRMLAAAPLPPNQKDEKK